MANPYPKGRMICKKISRSKGIATLSPEALALFCMILPHLDSFGKSNGDPMYVKAEMVPLIPWLDLPVIERCLAEIDANTDVRWFQGEDSTRYIHATKWDDHQKLEKRGANRLPSHPSTQLDDYSTTTRRPVGPEVEVELELKKKKNCPHDEPVRGAFGAKTLIDDSLAASQPASSMGRPDDFYDQFGAGRQH